MELPTCAGILPAMKVRLKAGKDKKIRNHYPWIFRDDIATHFADRGEIEDGSCVDVMDADGKFLGVGMYNARSHIVIRMLTRQHMPIDAAFWKRRIEQAMAFRKSLSIASDGIRWIHSEADGLPGLIVDGFGDTVVVQFRTLGMERWKDTLTGLLVETLQASAAYERSDMESRLEEGLEPAKGLLCGRQPEAVTIREGDLSFHVDIVDGHKTGFYLDQRDNRQRVRALVRKGGRALDLFSYAGAFGVAMAQAGASVVCVDSDPRAAEEATANAQVNRVEDRLTSICADAYAFLESENASCAAQPSSYRKFDVVVIDPPAIAKRKEGIDKLKWGYWRLLKDSLPLVQRGGFVVLSSCAYHMSTDLMQEAARFASADLGVRLRVVDVTFQPPDHPWMLQIPESLYLKTVYYQLV